MQTAQTIETISSQWRDALARLETARKLLGHAATVPVQKIMQIPDAVSTPDYKSEVWADHHLFLASYARLLLSAFEEADNPDYPTPVIPHVGAIQYKNNPDVPDNFQRLKIAAGYHGGEIPAWFPDPQISHETCTGNTSFGIALEPQGARTWYKRAKPTDPTDPKRAALAVLFGYLHWGGDPELQDHRYRDGRRPGLHRLPDPRVAAREALEKAGVPADLVERWLDTYKPWWAAWEHEIVGLYKPGEWEPWKHEVPGFTYEKLKFSIQVRMENLQPWELPRGWSPEACRRAVEEVAQEVFGRTPSPWNWRFP